ncbi:RNA-directed DNA polymerase (Reverse transcriptase) [Ruminiclostridium papyrosolvens DSM 2782]|uniref:RNA-directed DNA polymerase n=1 Tax=Ruminiclostridium papyrosolvens DSM 2782 TaxID=588581 RepID=F1T8Z5_9FIRM|nr:reverse transcriptase family protein [Ruminiclostridium papyrosolvens]EGD48977.1 RNA-directed DNA polymerase (Reverse transcriptase) [Ruminiclostridium papyrosolvens DSM 2782]WES35461.1 reverse transcriptase family protein [Ruminiclostridium papyrosolvens DSM 2782]
MRIYKEEYFYNSILQCNKQKVLNGLEAKSEAYFKYEIPKANNKKRTISALDKDSLIYELQSNLYKNFFSFQPIPVCVKGFVKGNSYLDFLNAHIYDNYSTYFVRLDIRDFFDSISKETMISTLQEFINIEDVINVIYDICTLEDKLPQGAVTSPLLSNLVLRRIDQRVTLYCQSLGVAYTRYADDLLFSSNEIDFSQQKWFVKKIKYILGSIDLKINYNKIKYGKDLISINGYVVNSNVNLSRKKLYNLTSVLYFFNKNKGKYKKVYKVDNKIFMNTNWLHDLNTYLKNSTSTNLEFVSVHKLQNFLIGYRAYLISCISYSSENKVNQYSSKIKHIESIINKLLELNQ